MAAPLEVERRFSEIRQRAKSRWESLWGTGKPVLTVGTATCGLAQGASEVLSTLRETGAKMGLDLEIREVGCIGHCYAEPLVTVKMPAMAPYLYGRVTPTKAELLLKYFVRDGDPFLDFAIGALEPDELMPPVRDLPRFFFERRLILEDCGLIDPEEIDHYLARGGYSAWVRSLTMEPQQIIQELAASGLRGRGGAGFPTARKWEACRSSPHGAPVVICNADEGDPGAYMDRAILESNPHQVIEGLAIAARAVGASEGYVYVRAEYPLAIRRVRKALEDARAFGLLGERILGDGMNLELKLFRGSGAFVCGEETALIASIQGQRGMPRPRPPFPAESGLWGRPTLVNNVKTLALVTRILRDGWEAFSAIGTESSRGTMVFSVVGKCQQPGLVEVPMGTTLRRLVFDICGGIQQDRAFKAVQIGGPSGGCLPASLGETPVDYEALSKAGAMMGSGGIVVLDEDDCMVEVARFFLEFTQGESCGKCTFCRIGTRQMLEILTDVTRGRATEEDLELLSRLAQEVKEGSLCNLGATAPNPVLTTLRYFQEEYAAHIRERRCPALQCRELIAYYIVPDRCAAGCDACVGTCPTEAIYTMRTRKKAVDQDKCVKCGECVKACPPQYRAVERISPVSQVPRPHAPPAEDVSH
ncbi:MAG: NADH-ubiquinone oxidoreductase-F iron-sulfur binding region domain-containing protein [Thermodesulfobacteriota bacterium]